MTWAVALTAAPLQGPGSWCLFSLVFDLLILHTFQLSSLSLFFFLFGNFTLNFLGFIPGMGFLGRK